MDVIARTAQALVFVEVRTRSSSQFGTPEESITRAKAERLILTAQAYLEQQSAPDEHWRIDLIAIECQPAGKVVRLDHYPNALLDFLDRSV
jgi:putative endonuclease